LSTAENFDEEFERLRSDLTRQFDGAIAKLKVSFQQAIDDLEKRILLIGTTYNRCRICQKRAVTDPEPSPIEAAWHRAGHPEVNWFEGNK